ncbi:succinyl-CoA synthetase (ADP-forming) beta subunit [Nitrosococcus oceani ATCC 19707]|uniref:Succinate--CoA ligase [ADP-forming] subunit beta n=2 Tax=Nitrosococcus oceani TaxID=1229 RepID=Q3JD69_NITOC|nr:ADP-forming succinate--CoA ligase subunit beta [Nitrosococcus oceani]ABA57227.1 succinyl-CoA synthetase (ADP-forming) beta subunit [Nitrosococcus oceani ATCC 19707]EDZ66019.1 succinyl-CoA synthetase, beta subunit subfamily [Nitrosococcus oceani AFC27]KFI20361.1 succinyl-CoA synthetase subunit beta [Nitrosococcus oceani C-27]GEM21651.1 succinate--CoA ligase subunit beta [Nitrosococcus oceani]
MILHEFQAKCLFSDYGIPVPSGGPAGSVEEARAWARKLGGERWVVKAQIHAGGRGKAGGVRVVSSAEELSGFCSHLLGTRLVTAQTDAAGLPVQSLLVEQPAAIAREFYLAATLDRQLERVVIMASSRGGVDIEQVAAKYPGEILRLAVHPIVGLQPYQCRRVGFAFGLTSEQRRQLVQIMEKMYRLFLERDANLVEMNPLVVTEQGDLLALDAKVVLDDNAAFRHAAWEALRDPTQENQKEVEARTHGLSYIALEGDIACMVNGAGLAMATMDLIKLQKGEPANFLDVGGTATAERVTEAFKLILTDTKVKSILVNIFGGIVRCDLIAEGIIQAMQEVEIQLPVVVRLEGTNAKQGRTLLRESGMKLITADNLTDAARKAVAAAGERA